MPDDIVAQAADGTHHVFPAGTDVAIVDAAMKRYASERQTGAMQTRKGGPIVNAAGLTLPAEPATGGMSREAGLGAASAILPESQMTTDWRQNLSNIGTGLNTQVNKAATTPWGQGGPFYGVIEMLAKGLMGGAHGIASGAEEMVGSVGQPTADRGFVDSSKFGHGMGAVLGNAATLGLLKKAPEALADPLGGEGAARVGREVFNEGASKARVLSDQHAHAIETQKHIAGVADAVHTDAQQAMAKVSEAVDAAKPEGAFDKGEVGNRLKTAIGDTVSDTSQLPKSVQKLMPVESTGRQLGPNIGGKVMDLSKPEDMAAYQKYKASGAFTPEEIAKYEGKSTGGMSFEELKQARSDLGKQMQNLQGAAKAAASSAYGELSKVLREGARDAGVEPDWIDANARWKNYLDDFHRSPIAKALESENAHDIMEPLTGKSRVPVLETLSKYTPFGIDMDRISQEVAGFGVGDTALKLSRPTKMDLLLARLSPTAVALRQVGPRMMRNPSVIRAIGGEGFPSELISPKKVFPTKEAAAAALKGKIPPPDEPPSGGLPKGNPTPFSPAPSGETAMEMDRRASATARKPLEEIITERRATEKEQAEAKRSAWEEKQRAKRREKVTQ